MCVLAWTCLIQIDSQHVKPPESYKTFISVQSLIQTHKTFIFGLSLSIECPSLPALSFFTAPCKRILYLAWQRGQYTTIHSGFFSFRPTSFGLQPGRIETGYVPQYPWIILFFFCLFLIFQILELWAICVFFCCLFVRPFGRVLCAPVRCVLVERSQFGYYTLVFVFALTGPNDWALIQPSIGFSRKTSV